jgi:PiT family inorganic phosphate transporter
MAQPFLIPIAMTFRTIAGSWLNVPMPDQFALLLTSLLAFYVAWNLGANDVANSMGTSVGSKAVTLRQALTIAGILEFTGAVLFGQRVSQTLITGVIDPAQFATAPQTLLLGMVAALIACGVWLQMATALGLPVASSHAIVGAIAGFGWVAIGANAVNWQSLGVVSLSWVLTPVVSGTIAAGCYSLIKRWILDQPDPIEQLNEWIPWLSAALVSVFGIIVLPVILRAVPIDRVPLPPHDLPLLMGAIVTTTLTVANWRQFNQTDRIDRATAQPLTRVERQMGRFQLLSACFVAFAHGSNDVGNAVAPLAAIVYIQATNTVPISGFAIPLWVLVLGGIGIVSGLAVWGKKVILTIGEGIIPLQPSGGFCAELAAAATILIASRLGLPVSTSHALVGAVVGIGIAQQQFRGSERLQVQTVQQIAWAWLVTIPIAVALSAGIFALLQQVWQ